MIIVINRTNIKHRHHCSWPNSQSSVANNTSEASVRCTHHNPATGAAANPKCVGHVWHRMLIVMRPTVWLLYYFIINNLRIRSQFEQRATRIRCIVLSAVTKVQIAIIQRAIAWRRSLQPKHKRYKDRPAMRHSATSFSVGNSTK